MKRASTFSAVMVAALAIGTAGPASAAMHSASGIGSGQSGSGAGPAGQSGTNGAGSGQSNPAGGQAGTSGAGSATSIAGGGQSGSGDMSGTQDETELRRDDRQDFIEKAGVANMAEIELGRLASTRAQDPQVKQFAQMMVDEHTQALDQLRSAAGGATLPSALDKKHQKLHDKLSTLQGAEFDRAYMDAMVDAHKDAEKLLKKRAGTDRSARRDTSPDGQTAMAGTSASTSGTSTSSGTDTSAPGTSAAGTPSQPGDSSGTTSAVGTSGVSSSSTPGSIDEWAAMTLPKVQSHLQQAKSLEDTLKQQAKPQPVQPNAQSPGSPQP